MITTEQSVASPVMDNGTHRDMDATILFLHLLFVISSVHLRPCPANSRTTNLWPTQIA